ncbi:MAG: dual specificity protein phosphatase family protein [Sulfobacillus sp.]
MGAKLSAFYRVAWDKSRAFELSFREVPRVIPFRGFREHLSSYRRQIATFFGGPTHIIDNVFLGSAYNAASQEDLRDKDITTILNVTKEIHNYFPEQFDYRRYLVSDDNQEEIAEFLEDAYQGICNAEGNVLVHCYLGASRSASVVVYYLMKKHGMSFDQAFAFLRDKRPAVNLSEKFARDLAKIGAGTGTGPDTVANVSEGRGQAT